MRRNALLALLAVSACELFQPPAEPLPPTWSSLESSDFGAMQNVSMSEQLWFGGGVTEPDIELAFRRGVKCILNLSFRGDEASFDLKRACESFGIELADVGLIDAESLSSDEADATLEILRDMERRPLLVFCEVGSNSAAFFALWRSLDHEMPLGEALNEARMSGMRPGALEEYVRAQHARLSDDD